jgi:hypothetical protein
MGRQKKVKCTKCGTPLFYLPNGYTMSFSVLCIRCEEGKPKKNPVQTATQKFSRTKKGKREDLGDNVFRSAMEANFARILNHLGIKYKFEERTFFFHNYKSRPYQYTPDFDISGSIDGFESGWYETKGWLDSQSRQKMRRFKKNYPEEAAKTVMVLYRKGDKKAIEFCQKTGYRYIFFDQLANKYAPYIPTWE